MAKGIIHRLELVQIDVDNRQPVILPAGLGHGLVQTIREQYPVRQIGQGVVVRHDPELLLDLFLSGDITEHTYKVGQLALLIQYAAQGKVQYNGLAFLVPGGEFPAPHSMPVGGRSAALIDRHGR